MINNTHCGGMNVLSSAPTGTSAQVCSNFESPEATSLTTTCLEVAEQVQPGSCCQALVPATSCLICVRELSCSFNVRWISCCHRIFSGPPTRPAAVGPEYRRCGFNYIFGRQRKQCPAT